MKTITRKWKIINADFTKYYIERMAYLHPIQLRGWPRFLKKCKPRFTHFSSELMCKSKRFNINQVIVISLVLKLKIIIIFWTGYHHFASNFFPWLLTDKERKGSLKIPTADDG